MKRGLIVALVLATASSAFAVYTGPWQNEWDFESGLDGWTLYGGGATYYTGGGSGPLLPGGTATYSNYGGNSLWLPDTSYARIPISSFTSTQLGANGDVYSGKQGFILQADVWVPNLIDDGSTLTTGNFGGQPGNAISQAGVGVEGTNIALYAEGKTDRLGVTARDFGWDNTARNASNTLNQGGTVPGLPPEDWWDFMVTFQIDYGYTTPGKWTAYAYIPVQTTASGTPGWKTCSSGNYDVSPHGSAADFLQLGGMYSWTQAQFDNVKIQFLPEPATLALLGLPLLLIRRGRHA
jgi:hypothetical protein